MRIGDNNLFEIGCRTCLSSRPPRRTYILDSTSSGVEAPSIEDFNTFSTRCRVHHTARLTSYCVVGPGTLLVPDEDEELEEYTVVYGSNADRRVWSGRGRVQEVDLRRKHAEYLVEMLPKFNRLRSSEVGVGVAVASPR